MLPCLCSRKSLSSISSMPCQSSNLVSIPRSRNQLFPQSYDSCFQYSVPLRPSSYLRLSHIPVGKFQLLSTSPSSMYPRIPFSLLLIYSQLGFQRSHPPSLARILANSRQSSSSLSFQTARGPRLVGGDLEGRTNAHAEGSRACAPSEYSWRKAPKDAGRKGDRRDPD